ncbi:OR4K1 isoform 3 [Pongo abelii]|uniref:Olfactory receptor n=1 Tax=Pongo abelii TaxID=9601 RepID=A0A2J8S8K4_PONAB|nr:olfactory receptor 4K1 [Pongo abelii]PNJ17094.1 OR4K1 isoform 1 [Pongo abelii]PNJ17095.1 OR4K1 isoform 2 [Pongo abelii]PNJ17096.1 OR4K1 isoform 3 [Pongo abelii]
MAHTNESMVSEFVLLGLSNSWELQLFFFAIFSIVYVTSVLGNVLITVIISFDSHLNSPMCFLLSNLSFIDICQSNFATPKMLVDFFVECKTISFEGCMAQIFLLHSFVGSEMMLLVAMAYDRFIAICKPLHCSTIMNQRLCIIFVSISWAVGILHSVSHLAFTVDLPFCGPNEVDSFFCDLPLVIELACMDTYEMKIMTLTNSGLISLRCFLALIISYTVILISVRHRSSSGSSKALSTLTAHITVVIIFFGPCIYFYIWPFSRLSVDKFLSVFYTVCTPLLNHIVYSLRNEDVKSAMRKLRYHHVNSWKN